MVDSRPCAVGPASTISGMRPPRLAATCSARVGLIRPLALAEGAASGLPVASSRSRIAGWAGARIAIVASPAVTREAIGGAAAERQDEGQRAGPIAFRQGAGLIAELSDFRGLIDAPDMDDERIEARTALGFVDAGDRFAVGRVGGEAVDGLGRHRDGLAGRDQPRRFGDRRRAIGQDAGVLRAHRGAL